MVKDKFKIIPSIDGLKSFGIKPGTISLRTADFDDIELLRNWKNNRRQYFFNKSVITRDEQEKWFRNFLKKEDDYIFIVNYLEAKAGCIGFRLFEKDIDIYNVILGEKKFSSMGIMSFSLILMCSYIADNYEKNITVRVLSDNPAIRWYEKNGFVLKEKRDDHVYMKLDAGKISYINYNIENF